MAGGTSQAGLRLVVAFVLVLAGFAMSLNCGQLRAAQESKQVPPIQVSTHMVTLEVVAKDRQGHHATGLTPADFQLFEQTPSRGKEKREQKIAVFREVRMADLVAQTNAEIQVPAGVYANLVTLQKEPVPPTILLVDGLNTDVKFQAQVHVQMLKMLKSLPTNVPVAVFLFGHRLKMLQDFTTDPRLLRAALEEAITPAGQGLATVNPRDDPTALSAQLEKLPNPPLGLIEAAKNFESQIYSSTMDMRVSETIDALMTLGRHVSGFPGRKNLLWISTTFPISLIVAYAPGTEIAEANKVWDFERFNNTANHKYGAQITRLAAVLSEAKVAVYPINPAGVRPPAFFDAGTIPRDYSARGIQDTLERETTMRGAEQDTMEAIAEQTGGRVCTGTNDLGDCVHKAVDDSSTFYEIAYYPDSENWNGEYRNIILKSRQSRLRLAYRSGYFARTEGAENATDQKTELQSACRDYLDATSIFIAAKMLPGDSPEKLKFYIMANLAALTLAPLSDGRHELNAIVAVCTFDQKGEPLQLMSEQVNRKFDAKEYQALIAAGGFAHTFSIPGPKPAGVRLIVKDVPSGRLGSIRIKVGDT